MRDEDFEMLQQLTDDLCKSIDKVFAPIEKELKRREIRNDKTGNNQRTESGCRISD